jgi:hypothetical protein
MQCPPPPAKSKINPFAEFRMGAEICPYFDPSVFFTQVNLIVVRLNLTNPIGVFTVTSPDPEDPAYPKFNDREIQ